MPKMKKKKSSWLAKKLQTLGLTGVFYEKTVDFAIFGRNKCDKQQDTVPLYITKGFRLILNFYCCRLFIKVRVYLFQTDIKFLLL